MDRSKFTKESLVKIKNVLSHTDVLEACTKERAITKWKFCKLTKITVFAALLRELPMGCKNAVEAETLAKKHTGVCLSYERLWEIRTMTIYVSSELSFCFRVEIGDLRMKLRKYSHVLWRKMKDLIQQVFRVFAKLIFQL